MAIISESNVGPGVSLDVTGDPDTVEILVGVRFQNTTQGEPTFTSRDGIWLHNKGHIGGVYNEGGSLYVVNYSTGTIEGHIRSGQDNPFGLINYGRIIGNIEARPAYGESIAVQIGNHGTIDGAIYVNGTTVDTEYEAPYFFYFENTGTLNGDLTFAAAREKPVKFDGSWQSQIHNHGTINGYVEAFENGRTFPFGEHIKFVNSGRITEYVQLYAGNDEYRAIGNGFVADYINGVEGNDTLIGGKMDDRLVGGDGRDQLWGRGDGDTLIGGAGADQLYGGTGEDTFIYTSAADSFGRQRDVIHDFRRGQDTLDFSDMVEGRLKYLGDDGFHGNGKAELRMVLGPKGRAMLQADVDGDGKADFTLTLLAQRGLLSADDFVL